MRCTDRTLHASRIRIKESRHGNNTTANKWGDTMSNTNHPSHGNRHSTKTEYFLEHYIIEGLFRRTLVSISTEYVFLSHKIWLVSSQFLGCKASTHSLCGNWFTFSILNPGEAHIWVCTYVLLFRIVIVVRVDAQPCMRS